MGAPMRKEETQWENILERQLSRDQKFSLLLSSAEVWRGTCAGESHGAISVPSVLVCPCWCNKYSPNLSILNWFLIQVTVCCGAGGVVRSVCLPSPGIWKPALAALHLASSCRKMGT